MTAHDFGHLRQGFVKLPAYPFAAHDLLRDLRDRLAKETGRKVGFAELGEMLGTSKSTAHFWFSVYRQPHILGFMTLLEQLSNQDRQAFLDAHCRVLPTIFHPSLANSIHVLEPLLGQQTGMTVITGSSDSNRSLVANALGHSWRRLFGGRTPVVGIDRHCPRDFVPVPRVRYIDDRLDLDRVRELARSIWGKLLTSSAQFILFNNLGALVRELGNDMLRMALTKHVVLAGEAPLPSFILEHKLPTPVRTLRLAAVGADGQTIQITCSTRTW